MEQNWWERFRQNIGAGWGDFMGAPGTDTNAASSEAIRRAGLALLGGATTDPYQAILQGIGTFSETRKSEMDRLRLQRQEEAKLAESLRKQAEAERLAEERAEIDRKQYALQEQQVARQTEEQKRALAEREAQVERNKALISTLPPTEKAAAEAFAPDPKAFEDWYKAYRSEQAANNRIKVSEGYQSAQEAARFARAQEADRYVDHQVPEGMLRYDRKEARYVGFAPSPVPHSAGEPTANAKLSFETSMVRANIQAGMSPDEAVKAARATAEKRFGQQAGAVEEPTGPAGSMTSAVRQIAAATGRPDDMMREYANAVQSYIKAGMTQIQAEAAAYAELMADLQKLAKAREPGQ